MGLTIIFRRLRWAIGLLLMAPVLSCPLVAAEPARAGEALAIIVNKANPLENLTTEELRKYFRLERERWPDGRKNIVLMLPTGTPEREGVLRGVFKLTESDLGRYYLQASFTGQIHTTPKEMASAGNVRKFVFNVPGAIGYLRASQVDDMVKVVRIDGLLPGDTGYTLIVAAR